MSLTKLRCIRYILKKKAKLKPAATSLYGVCPESQRNAKKCHIILGSVMKIKQNSWSKFED